MEKENKPASKLGIKVNVRGLASAEVNWEKQDNNPRQLSMLEDTVALDAKIEQFKKRLSDATKTPVEKIKEKGVDGIFIDKEFRVTPYRIDILDKGKAGKNTLSKYASLWEVMATTNYYEDFIPSLYSYTDEIHSEPVYMCVWLNGGEGDISRVKAELERQVDEFAVIENLVQHLITIEQIGNISDIITRELEVGDAELKLEIYKVLFTKIIDKGLQNV